MTTAFRLYIKFFEIKLTFTVALWAAVTHTDSTPFFCRVRCTLAVLFFFNLFKVTWTLHPFSQSFDSWRL